MDFSYKMSIFKTQIKSQTAADERCMKSSGTDAKAF